MIERHRAAAILNDLFPLFLAEPAQMPDQWQAQAQAARDQTERARVVLDYVAGMTDRYAISLHQRLFP